MGTNNLRFFMREELKQDVITEIPGVKTFCDENGQPMPMKVRSIGSDELLSLRDACKTRRMVKDAKGRPLLVNGQVQYSEEYDSSMVSDALIAAALVFPDLHDKQLLEFYGEQEATKLVRKLFRRVEDYNYISEKVSELSGLQAETQEIVDEIKN